MKKFVAILVAAIMVCALSVCAFADGTATATGSFVCTFVDNDYDTNVATLTGVAIDGTWGGQFPFITEIIEKVAPLSQVTAIEVTIKASNTDACWNGTTPKCELHWNTRDGENAMTADFVDGVAVVSGTLPEGINNVVLNPYAFSSEVGEISFDVSVAVTYTGEANVSAAVETPAVDETPVVDETPAPATNEAPATNNTPAAPATGIALAVVPAVVALAAVAVSKKH